MKLIIIAMCMIAAISSACAPVVKQTHAIQPSQAVDTPSVWVEIVTDDPAANGVYRCTDDGKQPVCRKAQIVR